MVNIYEIIAIFGLISIISGTFMLSFGKKIRRRYLYPFLLIGGVCLTIYSINIKDIIFIILQSVYTLIVIYDITKLILSKRKNK
jgi:lipid-A-disaccharide synthase-like uncharacterized protein